jgi:hypothetical protein
MILSAVTAILLLTAGSAFADITMTFEEFRGGPDATPISTYYQGISFQSGAGGSEWVARRAESNSYNISSWPSGQQWNGGTYWIDDFVSATTALGYGGDDGRISFDDKNATYVELHYSASGGLNLVAYNESGAVLDSAFGPSNLRYINGNESGPDTLRVVSATDYIAYVIVHDTGNYWTVDNITTDASGITVIPAPAAILLGMVGLGVVGWLKRRVG